MRGMMVDLEMEMMLMLGMGKMILPMPRRS
jgi:hypothetical protein